MSSRKQKYGAFDIDEENFSWDDEDYGDDGDLSEGCLAAVDSTYVTAAASRTRFSLADHVKSLDSTAIRGDGIDSQNARVKSEASPLFTNSGKNPIAIDVPFVLPPFSEEPPSIDPLSSMSDGTLIRIAHFLSIQSRASLSCVNKSLDLALASLMPSKFPPYLKPPANDLLSSMSDDVIIRVSHFLPIRSLGLLSCVNKSLDSALASDFLYCWSLDDDAQTRLHPDLRNVKTLLPDGHMRPKGVARKFALEAHIFDTSKRAQHDHIFWLSDEIIDKSNSDFDLEGNSSDQIIDPISNVQQSKIRDIAFFGSDTIAFTRYDSPEVMTRSITTHETVSSCIPNSDYLIRSSFAETANGQYLFASLTSSSEIGLGIYYLTLMELAVSSDEEQGFHEVLCQKRMDALSSEESALEFSEDGQNLLVSLDGHDYSIIDVESGEEVWCHSFETSVLMKPSLFGTVLMLLAERTIQMFDIRNGDRASVRLPSDAVAPKKLCMANDQLWLIDLRGSYRTNVLLWETVQQLSNSIKCWTKRIHQKNNARTPIIATCQGYTYVAFDHSILVYDPKVPSKPVLTFDTYSCIDMMFVDNTKIIYTDGYQKVRIIPIDSSSPTQLDAKLAEQVYAPFMKPDYSITSFVLKGNYLAVSYYYSQSIFIWSRQLKCKCIQYGSEIRVFDLTKVDGGLLSYNTCKAHLNDWQKCIQKIRAYGIENNNETETIYAENNSTHELELEKERRKDTIRERVEAKEVVKRERKASARYVSKQVAYQRRMKDLSLVDRIIEC